MAAMLDAMTRIAQSRSRERMMKGSRYSSARLSSRLVSRDEDIRFSPAMESAYVPTYLRRKVEQGKGTSRLWQMRQRCNRIVQAAGGRAASVPAPLRGRHPHPAALEPGVLVAARQPACT